MSKQPSNPENESLKQKMARLDALVAWFESDDFSLEESFDKFEAAGKLAAEIEEDLEKFSNKVTVIAKRFDEE